MLIWLLHPPTSVISTFFGDVVDDAGPSHHDSAVSFCSLGLDPDFSTRYQASVVQTWNSCKNLNLNGTNTTSFNIITNRKKDYLSHLTSYEPTQLCGMKTEEEEYNPLSE